jgi:hypothetical protein
MKMVVMETEQNNIEFKSANNDQVVDPRRHGIGTDFHKF